MYRNGIFILWTSLRRSISRTRILLCNYFASNWWTRIIDFMAVLILPDFENRSVLLLKVVSLRLDISNPMIQMCVLGSDY